MQTAFVVLAAARMKPTLAMVVALLATTATAITQDQATPSYVASPIRPTPDATNRSTGFRPGGFFMTGGTIRLIIDKTGLDGFYEFSLEWAPPPPPSPDAPPDPRPNIFTALQEQLGLKLEPSTTAVQVVVIDHIERPSGTPR